MSASRTSAIDYERCVAYYRAGRRIEGAAGIERYLAAHPRLAERAARDAEHDLALAQRYDPVLDEPIPPRLLRRPAVAPSPWLARAGLAVAIGVSVSAGWWLRGVDNDAPSPDSKRITFGQQVARLAERQPTVDTAASGSPSHPDLSRAGYRFSGQRTIATNGQPLTAYEYRNTAGQQITIYSRAQPGANTAQPDLISPAGTSLARWHSDGRAYALTGNLPPAALDRLADVASKRPRRPAARQSTGPAAPIVDMPQQRAPSTAPPGASHQPEPRTAVQKQPASGL
ncbi:hypothetical protein V5738_13490 [Salinisphaera sp. SPP-AMP-43]|uniref:anti-sigma factor family protein n=1 Tax=Salinisphaera sp. SPP-AMP-43 TaxID=3121288 RepID=UPI003C6E3B6D